MRAARPLRANARRVAPWALALVACVDPRHDFAQGTPQFLPGGVSNSADYAPGSGPLPSAGGAAPSQPGLQAAGSVAPAPTAVAGTAAPVIDTAGVGGAGPVVGGTGAAGASGSAEGASGAGGTGSTALAGSGGAPAPSTGMGTLTLHFTSVNQGGRYAPRNVGAVWVETASGTFVKTLKRWAGIRANHLTAWAGSAGGWSSFFGFGATPDELDAITAATLRTHQAHDITWDMKDPMDQLVPDGAYEVFIEVTEDNFVPGASSSVAFDKGSAPVSIDAPDQEPYSGLTLRYQP